MTSATYWQLTIDCHDPGRMVAFWGPVLGYDVRPAPDGFATWNEYYLSVGVPEEELDLTDPTGGADRLIDPSGRGPAIWFQPVPENKAGKNRLHLDLYAVARERPYLERRRTNQAWADDLVARGASIVAITDEEEFGRFFVTMQDPEGNEFCLG